jgi:regulatory protein
LTIPRRAKESGQARPLAGDDEVRSTADQLSSDPSDACYQSALNLLGYRARAEAEMRQRLSRKGFGQVEIEQTVTRLKASGLIDDAAFAKAWSESRSASSPRSAYVVKRELRTKGIDGETAEAATVELDDAEAAYRAAQPRLGRLQSLPPEEARRKLSDFLRRRGFGWTVIERTLSRLREEGRSSEVDSA